MVTGDLALLDSNHLDRSSTFRATCNAMLLGRGFLYQQSAILDDMKIVLLWFGARDKSTIILTKGG